ncbi:reverse transcriptase-like protein [Gracilibacillus oryzae]|uniref:Reverse transcriptase-like protein n=1 Tax=Gracilibacillus oryzae TaxID=1672701 RepID=A0A7C8GQE3_9BACI|nr:reverse transcriptase-like protein [Gracilibacillus oryzae]KAB8126278.1 reverse transcriptase-like protein [Gracilibacillus oryzae]
MKIRIEIQYHIPKGLKTVLNTAFMSIEHAISLAEDLMKINRIKELTFFDSNESSWTLKEMKKYVESLKEEPYDVCLYFDGGFDHETWQSGLGCVIYYKQNEASYRIRKNALVDQLTSNNEAEYAALHFGLKQLEEMGVHHLPVTIKGDSKVVINQLTDEWPCLEETLSQWIDRIELLTDKLGVEPIYEVISRKKNQEADHLATQALREIEISSRSEG